MLQKKQLFLSHNWGDDNISRDNHDRVKTIKKILNNFFGWSTWFDEDDMGWSIDGSMLKGIYECDIILIFITSKYLNKIEENCLNPENRDNCAKEWNLINITRKKIIPVIMERELMSVSNWKHTLMGMYLATHMLIDMSSEINVNTVFKLHNWIIKNFKLNPINELSSRRQLYNNKYFLENKSKLYFLRHSKIFSSSKRLLFGNNVKKQASCSDIKHRLLIWL